MLNWIFTEAVGGEPGCGCVVRVADLLHGGRPGARRDSAEVQVRRDAHGGAQEDPDRDTAGEWVYGRVAMHLLL